MEIAIHIEGGAGPIAAHITPIGGRSVRPTRVDAALRWSYEIEFSEGELPIDPALVSCVHPVAIRELPIAAELASTLRGTIVLTLEYAAQQHWLSTVIAGARQA